MKHKLTVAILLAGVVAAPMFGQTTASKTQQSGAEEVMGSGTPASCSNATLTGAYGTQDNWHDPNGPNFYVVARMNFNGKGQGTVSFEAVRGDDGTVTVNTDGYAFTYKVDPHCTFTFTHENGLTFSGVVVKNAQELRYVETTGWQFRVGTAAKVNDENRQP